VAGNDDADDVAPKERSRQRRRDRKRETRMVVDNAGVRRVLPAVEQRRTRSAATKPRDDENKDTR